jgi:hypothetical protein
MSEARPTGTERRWFRLEPSPLVPTFGCLFSMIGFLLGSVIGIVMDRAEVAQIRADNPTAMIDGWPVLPLIVAIVIGLQAGFCGLLIGASISSRRK